MTLASPGRKQDIATKLGIFSTYSPRRPVYFYSVALNFQPSQKEKIRKFVRSNAAAKNFASEEKWRLFNCFFSPGNRWDSDWARFGE